MVREEEDQRWIDGTIRTQLQACSIRTPCVTVALTTPQEFKDSWELGLAVVVFPHGYYERLGFGGRPVVGSMFDIGSAMRHIFAKPDDQQEDCLYVWPGDQSDQFLDYPKEPLSGRFTSDRLQAVLVGLSDLLGELYPDDIVTNHQKNLESNP